MKRFIQPNELARDRRFKRAKAGNQLVTSLPNDAEKIADVLELVGPKIRERIAGTVGPPLPGVAVRVVAADGRPCAAGEVGGITGPGITSNSHELEVEGAFGRMVTRTENVASPQNPKTSYLAVLSACAMLNEILNPVKVGT